MPSYYAPEDTAEMSLDLEREKKLRAKYNAETQQHWMAKIVESVQRLDIEQRAENARIRKNLYARYRQDDPNRTINAISRKEQSKVLNIVAENPEITPQFSKQLDDQNWRGKISGFIKRQIARNRLKYLLKELVWDNIYGDIGWLKIEWATEFSAGLPTGGVEEKQALLAQRERIEEELWETVANGAPMIRPDDLHAAHIVEHEKHLAWLSGMAQTGQVPGGAAEIMDIHLAQHRQMDAREDAHIFQARRWPSYNVYYDPDASCWDDCRWYAVELTEQKEVLLANPQLKNVKPLRGGAGDFKDPWHEMPRGRRSRNQRVVADGGQMVGLSSAPVETYIRYYVIHNLEGDDSGNQQMVVIADTESHDQKPLLITGWPFIGRMVEPFVLNPVNDQVHGVCDIERLELIHNQIIAIDFKIAEIIDKTPALKFFITQKLANDPQFTRAANDPHQLWAMVQELPKESVMPFVFPGLDKNLLDRRAELMAELEEESGIPEVYTAGETSETATATTVKDRQAGNKINDAKNRLAETVSWYCDGLVNTWRQNGTVDQWVRVVDDAGVAWDMFTPADIPHGIDWLVDSDSLSPTRREMEKKQDVDLITVLTPWFGQWINPPPLLARILRKWGVDDVSEILMQPPVAQLPPLLNPGPGGPPGGAPQQPGGMPQQGAEPGGGPDADGAMGMQAQQPQQPAMAGQMSGAVAGGAMG